MRKRRMSAEERKLAIVRAALPLFARKGFAETTTRALARAAGVSEPLLYKHFPSKEALYLEIQDFSCQCPETVAKRLTGLEPSTSTLVQLVYFLLRALVLGRPAGEIPWNTRHRLMLNSLLEDGVYARLAFQNRFGEFCAQLEASLAAATECGDVVPSPVSPGNRTRFTHHLGGWIALVQLPRKAAIEYEASRAEVLNQTVWFALRGMGMTDQALAAHYNPKALALSFDEN